MEVHFPTDASEKSLAPFFSPPVVSSMIYGLVIISGLVLVSWPREPLFFYIGSGRGPMLFFQSFSATLIFHAYLNLRCGRGELIETDFTHLYQKEESVQEKEIHFLRYGLIVCLAHAMFLLLPFLPILMLVSGASGVSVVEFLQALSVLYSAALLSRLFGFFVYLLWGRLSVVGYLVVRGFAVFYLFATIGFARDFNPLRMIYALNRTGPNPEAYTHFTVASLFSMLTVVLMSTLMVNRHIHEEKNR